MSGLLRSENGNEAVSRSAPLMDRSSARSILNSLWVLIYTATYRALSTEEDTELRRHADLIENAIPRHALFNAGTHVFTKALADSGLLRGEREAARLDHLLEYTDQLRNLLD